MFFLNPTYLWALLGLAIPLAIHLWSKREGKTIKIGSIKLLSEADSKQNSSIKLNELWLLLIRLLLITIVVLIMAEPQLRKDVKNTKLTYLVESSLLKDKSISSLLDTLSKDASFRLFKKGFPEFTLEDELDLKERVPNYWQLAREMETLHSDSVVVFAKGFLKGLKGKRPEINANVQWIVLDDSKTSEHILRVTHKNDDIELLSLLSNSQNLSFKKHIISSSSSSIEWNERKDSLKINDQSQAIESLSALKVLIFNTDKFDKEAIYINAAFKAISKYIDQPINIQIESEDATNLSMLDYDYLVWLSDEKPIEVSGKLLTFNPDKYAPSLIVKGEKNNRYNLTKPLDSESIIDEHLVEQLISTLGLADDLSAIILEKDKRVVAKEELRTIFRATKKQKNYAKVLNISKWLWLLLASGLILERIVANYRKQ